MNEGILKFVNSIFPLVNSSGKPEELEPLVGSWGYLRKDEKRWRKPYCQATLLPFFDVIKPQLISTSAGIC